MIGRRISGRYEILSRIGDGGMAVVYKAKDLILDRLCAVKMLRHEFSGDEAFIRRFRREAEAVASLSHANIVNIYDIGEEDDLYYIVMEYIDGITLKSFIKEYAPVPPEDAIYILKQIASAIEHAHQHGIVHRDIKPQNILIDNHDRVKVTDFGIAQAITSATITYTTSIIGSAHYLSPEQAKGGKATIKSDIYAFGIVMYEMLTGQLPFPGDSPVTVALKHLNESYPLPTEINPGLPQSLENIIIRSLAKDPDERYDTISDVYDDLTTALNPERIHEPRIELLHETDAEKTRIMPTATPNDHNNYNNHIMDEGDDRETPPFNGKKGKDNGKTKKKMKNKKKKWLITTIVVLSVAILAIILYLLFSVFSSGGSIEVPKVTGKTYNQAVEMLRAKQLYAERKDVEEDGKPAGVVVKQNPNQGASVKKGTTITLYVNKGPKKEEVQDYVGYSKDTVEQLLQDNNPFKDVVWVPQESADVPAGQIISQKPEPNTKIVPSKTVLQLTYSTGPPTAKVPDVVGDDQDSATSALQDAGFEVKVADGDYSDEIQKGYVMRTDPEVGQSLEQGQTVTIYLSKGPEKKPETVVQSITITVDDTNPGNGPKTGPNANNVHVQIYITDANNQHKLFKDETINSTKTYNVPLTVPVDGQASYQVYTDGQLVKEDTITYDEVHSSGSGGED
ncbi:MAG: Stk1 family PASTA domain-containing Ser/Thr kinase [Tuberibacillus sp.]